MQQVRRAPSPTGARRLIGQRARCRRELLTRLGISAETDERHRARSHERLLRDAMRFPDRPVRFEAAFAAAIDRIQPMLLNWMRGFVSRMPPKAYRWVAEMEEIASTFAAAGQPDGFHRAAAEVFAETGRPDSGWCALGSVKSQIGCSVRMPDLDCTCRQSQRM